MIRLALHSVPRSGSTWLGTIFDSHPSVVYKYQPLFSYRYKDYLTPSSSRKEIMGFFDKLLVTEDDFMDQQSAKEKGIVPAFPKADHTKAVVYKEVRYHNILENMLKNVPEIKVIGLIRNPMATIYSWLNAPREFRKDKGWTVEEEWRFAPKKNQNRPEEFNGYEKWKEVAFMFEEFRKEYPDRFLLIQYKNLLADVEHAVEHMFEFVGLKVHAQTHHFLEESRQRELKDAYGVYKSKNEDDAWRGNLDETIIQFIEDDLQGTTLEKYLQ